jgi:hypothetical protein
MPQVQTKYLRLGDKLVKPLAFPSAEILKMEPTMNVFYDSGVKKETTGLTTIYGDLMSLLIHGAPVLFKGVPQLVWLAFMWIKTTLFGGGHDGGGGGGLKND